MSPYLPRKCLPDLLHYPRAGRVFRDVEMQNPASTVLDEEETIQDSQRGRRHCEKVHGRDDLAGIAQEGSPEFSVVVGRRQTTEMAGHGTLRDIRTEFKELAMNSWSAPAWIFLCHRPNERSNLRIDRWPAKAPWP